MKKIRGFYLGNSDQILGYNDNRPISVGITHCVKGKIIPCKWGLHLSPKPIDALRYSIGPVLWCVEGRGTIVGHGNPTDKYACSIREYISGGIDISDELYIFARECALDVLHLWDAPEIVQKYLNTGDHTIRDAAHAAAHAAARADAHDAANSTAWSAAHYAANCAAWSAAHCAAWSAAHYAANSTAWFAAHYAANCAAAHYAAWSAAHYAANSTAWFAAHDADRAAAHDADRAAAHDADHDAAHAAAYDAAHAAAHDAKNKRLTKMILKRLVNE